MLITTFGSGNGPTDDGFIGALRAARGRGIELLNVTQCIGGRVEQGRYATSRAFADMGVIACADMTVEAALAKTMFLLGKTQGTTLLADGMTTPACGEFTWA
jgi:L-asparaginase